MYCQLSSVKSVCLSVVSFNHLNENVNYHSVKLFTLEFLCTLFFQVTASEALPASMFIPVPSPDRESQSTPHATANSNSEDTKKQVG